MLIRSYTGPSKCIKMWDVQTVLQSILGISLLIPPPMPPADMRTDPRWSKAFSSHIGACRAAHHTHRVHHAHHVHPLGRFDSQRRSTSFKRTKEKLANQKNRGNCRQSLSHKHHHGWIHAHHLQHARIQSHLLHHFLAKGRFE